MNVYFKACEGGPERAVAEAEVHFDADTPLAGLKIMGLTIWRGKGGDTDLFVTMPARAFGVGSERRYFDYLRAADPAGSAEGRAASMRFKAWVLDEYWKDRQSKDQAAQS